MVDFLEHQRSRLRVARSTVLNTAVAGVFGSIAAWQTPWTLGVPLIAVAACLLAWQAFVAIDKSYNTRLLEAYELVKDKAPARAAD